MATLSISKEHIIEQLEILKKNKVLEGAEPFAVRAYTRIITNIQQHPKCKLTLKDLKEIKGVGKKTAEKLEQLYTDGEIQEVIEVTTERQINSKAMDELTTIAGIGPVKAKLLMRDHGIRSIVDLRLSHYTDLLTDTQQIGLKYHEDFQKRIPRSEMELHKGIIGKAVKSVDKDCKFEMVGSYRRGLLTSGDIDIILTHTSPTKLTKIIEEVITSLEKSKYIFDTVGMGQMKYMGVCRLPATGKKVNTNSYRKLDIIASPFQRYPFTLIYYTGPQEFEIRIRKLARTMGYSLSQYGFKSIETGKYLQKKFTSEEEIMNYLGFQYLEPDERTKGVDLISVKKPYTKLDV
jgi:DNA polymerase beta